MTRLVLPLAQCADLLVALPSLPLTHFLELVRQFRPGGLYPERGRLAC